MHELAVTQSVLEIAQRHARDARATRVVRLHLVLGDLSGFVDDSVRFSWDLISKGTLCEGAELCFRRVPARILCLDCNKDSVLKDELVPCPACGSFRVRVTGGDDLRLESMDIETDETGEADPRGTLRGSERPSPVPDRGTKA